MLLIKLECLTHHASNLILNDRCFGESLMRKYKSHILFLVFLMFSKLVLANSDSNVKDYHLARCSDGTTEYIHSNKLSLSSQDITRLGKIIFKHECAGKYKNLITWNKGENFPSLGIGHFIWYPKNKEGPFHETFPKLVQYIKEKGVKLPLWLASMREIDAPWKSRKEFFARSRSNRKKLYSLRKFLINTMNLQTLFIIKRLNSSLPKLLCSVPPAKRFDIRNKFYLIADSPGGLYSLIDYINFKGEGLSPKERYKGQGWGLLQVLEQMNPVIPNKMAVIEFSKAAKKVLTRRVYNSPKRRHEKRWLKGWKKRINSYTKLGKFK
jgi:hypothetical protein